MIPARAYINSQKAFIGISWTIFACRSAHAGATEIIDFGNLAEMLVAYVVGLIALSLSLRSAKRKTLKAVLFVLYILAPFVLVVVDSTISHAANRHIEEQREQREHDRIEALDVFPKFCRERGEKLPACDKYRNEIPTDGGGECDAKCRLRWQK